jgi:hypothetical protein
MKDEIWKIICLYTFFPLHFNLLHGVSWGKINIANPNFENRNPKQYQNLNVLNFKHLIFGICLVFRASCFEFIIVWMKHFKQS